MVQDTRHARDQGAKASEEPDYARTAAADAVREPYSVEDQAAITLTAALSETTVATKTAERATSHTKTHVHITTTA